MSETPCPGTEKADGGLMQRETEILTEHQTNLLRAVMAYERGRMQSRLARLSPEKAQAALLVVVRENLQRRLRRSKTYREGQIWRPASPAIGLTQVLTWG